MLTMGMTNTQNLSAMTDTHLNEYIHSLRVLEYNAISMRKRHGVQRIQADLEAAWRERDYRRTTSPRGWTP